MCETTALLDTHCHQSDYWSRNKFCQLSCFEAGNGYDKDECCDNPATCNICTDEETPWMNNHDKNVNQLHGSRQNVIKTFIGV